MTNATARRAQGIGGFMRATRAAAIAMDDASGEREFFQRFNLKPGDYLEMDRGLGFKPCRILSVDEVWRNSTDGYSANVKLATLTVTGRMGTGRGTTLFINADGTGLTCHRWAVRKPQK